jgi:NAD(P)-dependent dehydrogenase (short-subunit alcohol dehydrogenase family)
MPPEIIDAWLQRIPSGRLVATEEIAEAVAYFASPAAGSTTGQELLIDGGQSLNSMSVTGSIVRARAERP